MRILFLLFVTLVSFAQEKKIKTWADKDDFITSEIELIKKIICYVSVD